MKRLNGWQRLWIVLSVLYAIPVTVLTVSSIADSEDPWNNTRTGSTLRALASHPESEKIKVMPLEKQRELAIDSARARLRLAGGSDGHSQTNEEFVRDISQKWAHVIDFSAIEAEQNKMIEQRSTARTKSIGYGFLAWVAPIALVYLLGLSFGWIVRGFRDGRS